MGRGIQVLEKHSFLELRTNGAGLAAPFSDNTPTGEVWSPAKRHVNIPLMCDGFPLPGDLHLPVEATKARLRTALFLTEKKGSRSLR